MAFFKFRKGGDETAPQRPQPESVEAMRTRARHRLIGAGVLVLLGVIGFPLLFDTQPRPIAVDIPIEIPDRNKAKPLPMTPQPAVQAPVAAGPVMSGASTAKPVASAAPKEPVVAAARPAEPAPKVVASAAPAPELAAKVAKAEPEAKPSAKPAATPNDGARAQALLEGKAEGKTSSASASAADGRFVVQVGAFADAAKARETRLKVERAGLKTYTHVAETKEGKRIRVRVGPFASKAEADKAAEKIKGLDLPAAILTL